MSVMRLVEWCNAGSRRGGGKWKKRGEEGERGGGEKGEGTQKRDMTYHMCVRGELFKGEPDFALHCLGSKIACLHVPLE